MLGLLTLVLLPGQGGELERPLAIVMIGGLVTSTLFTLLALPTSYSLVYGLQPVGADSRQPDWSEKVGEQYSSYRAKVRRWM